MMCLTSATELSQKIKAWKVEGCSVAFVPTMGNLHQGHLSLVEKAKGLADKVVVSIYVNPMQFGVGEDLDSYPRTLPEDQKLLNECAVDLLFLPNNSVMYPGDMENDARVVLPELSQILCGEARPSHFAGVTTVVNKLLNIVQPDIAIFGEKDYQQVFLIKKMVADLFMPVTVLSSPTVREASGLAMSSRNQYLTSEQHLQAASVYQVLQGAKDAALAGEDLRQLESRCEEKLTKEGFRVDYVSFRSTATLQIAESKMIVPKFEVRSEVKSGVKEEGVVLLIAAWLGKTRLIDNLVIR